MRLSDNTRWQKEWFSSLSIKAKLLYDYIWDNCDIAGFLELNFAHISFLLGIDIADHDFDELEKFIEWYEDDTIFIKRFIYETNGRLDGAAVVTKTIRKKLEERDFIDWYLEFEGTISQPRKPRARLTTKLKNEIKERDKCCKNCSATDLLSVIKLDGDSLEKENLVAVCPNCEASLLKESKEKQQSVSSLLCHDKKLQCHDSALPCHDKPLIMPSINTNTNIKINNNINSKSKSKSNLVDPFALCQRFFEITGKKAPPTISGDHFTNLKNACNFAPYNLLNAWEKVFGQCAKSDFLMKSQWFSIYWIIKYENLSKVAIGSYDNEEEAKESTIQQILAGEDK